MKIVNQIGLFELPQQINKKRETKNGHNVTDKKMRSQINQE
jgi:hypothetical protein